MNHDDQGELENAAAFDHGATDIVVPHDRGAAGDALRFGPAVPNA